MMMTHKRLPTLKRCAIALVSLLLLLALDRLLLRPLLYRAQAQPATTDTAPASFSVMTANIRAAMPGDKEETWQNRRELLVRTILKYQPDIVGFQEVTPAQGAYLVAHMVGYTRVAEPPGDAAAGLLDMGDALASLNQIFYNTQRLKLLTAKRGSLRPEVPATNLNENACYSLALLTDQTHLLPDLIIIDTHLRHDTAGATKACDNLQAILQLQLKEHPEAQAIVLGDMNHDRTSTVYQATIGSPQHPESILTDTFRYTDKPPKEHWGTYHNFTGRPWATWPTDLIFITRGLQATPAVIVRDDDPKNHLWPSDHFLVLSTITKAH
jgi:endonuclease/exonuclease/phosphatase family metal-dependent hydrolase